MKKTTLFSIIMFMSFSLVSVHVSAQKLVSSKTHFKFFSSTSSEDIEANNYKTVGTIETSTGEVVFSVPMQSFEFKKSLMQQHFNGKKYLDTKTNPKAKLKGKIDNLSEVNFEEDGSYPISISGELTINGVTNAIAEEATILVEGGKVSLDSKFNITLADYEVAFEKGKPAKNIAKVVEVTVKAVY